MERSEFKHDVDYNVPIIDNEERLNLAFDNLRIGGLAHLEELHQLLSKNRATVPKWNVDKLLSQLEAMIETLRKEI